MYNEANKKIIELRRAKWMIARHDFAKLKKYAKESNEKINKTA